MPDHKLPSNGSSSAQSTKSLNLLRIAMFPFNSICDTAEVPRDKELGSGTSHWGPSKKRFCAPLAILKRFQSETSIIHNTIGMGQLV